KAAAEPSKESTAADRKADQEGPREAKPAQAGSPLDIAKQSLAEAKTNQKAIADELQKMLDGLSEFETYRGVVKDAQGLLKKQEQAMKQTAEVASRPELTGKPVDELTPEQKADLGNLASRQSQVKDGWQ